MVGIVGANGAGKTTLVRRMVGLLEEASGVVQLDDLRLETLEASDRLSYFGLLSQEFGRYELTIRDALLLGTTREAVADDELWAALETASLRDAVEKLPHGLETQLGQQFDGVGLSGGQWQRLALARIALRDAPIWVLDEPTSSVDAETERDIFDDLAAGKAGRITFVVSHRASTLVNLDRIYVIDGVTVVQSGTFDELSEAPGRFREIFRDQR